MLPLHKPLHPGQQVRRPGHHSSFLFEHISPRRPGRSALLLAKVRPPLRGGALRGCQLAMTTRAHRRIGLTAPAPHRLTMAVAWDGVSYPMLLQETFTVLEERLTPSDGSKKDPVMDQQLPGRRRTNLNVNDEAMGVSKAKTAPRYRGTSRMRPPGGPSYNSAEARSCIPAAP